MFKYIKRLLKYKVLNMEISITLFLRLFQTFLVNWIIPNRSNNQYNKKQVNRIVIIEEILYPYLT